MSRPNCFLTQYHPKSQATSCPTLLLNFQSFQGLCDGDIHDEVAVAKTSSRYSKNTPPLHVSMSRLAKILDSVEGIMNNDGYPEGSIFMDLEPTPIGPNGLNVVLPPQTESGLATSNATGNFTMPKNRDITLDATATAATVQSSSSSLDEDVQSSSEPLAKKRRRSVQASAVSSKDAEEFHGSGRFRSYQADQWMERYEELIQYKELHANCLVPHTYSENQPLAQWVKRQRYQYKLRLEGRRSTLTDKRLVALEHLGFTWDSHAASWSEQFEALREFHSKQGSCLVPAGFDENKTLAVWVKCQRRQLKLLQRGKKSTMTKERFELLESLDFEWNPRNL